MFEYETCTTVCIIASCLYSCINENFDIYGYIYFTAILMHHTTQDLYVAEKHEHRPTENDSHNKISKRKKKTETSPLFIPAEL